MPSSCVVVGCARRHTPESGVKTFRIPKAPERLNLWYSAINRRDPSGKKFVFKDHHRICNHHFVTGKPTDEHLHVDYVPTLHLAYKKRPLHDDESEAERGLKKRARLERLKGRQKTTKVMSPIVDEPVVDGIATQTDTIFRQLAEKLVQTQETGPLREKKTKEEADLALRHQKLNREFDEMKKQMLLLDKEKEDLQRKCDTLQDRSCNNSRDQEICHDIMNKRFIGHGFIVANDNRTRFYTGLPNYETFRVLCQQLSPHVSKQNAKLSVYDELLMVLMKLRLNPPMQDLGHRFGLKVGAVSKQFHKWLDVLYEQLGGLVMWPTTDFMQLPESFQTPTFKKTKVIIDCFEIFMERPTSLLARAQTWSNYKHHNTVKVLIGVSPSGAVIFLSKCWGGRVSDKKITNESGLMDRLNPGDVVLADRGFTVTEEFAMRNINLMMPSFTKGKKQLAAKEVEDSRRLARVRIHVERVIKRVRDYKILKGPLPIALVKSSTSDIATIDKIVQVCSALTNLSPPCLES